MAEIKNKEIIITDDNGKENKMEILFTYHHDERNKSYVFFYDPKAEEDIIVMSYTDDGELFPIEDDEEFNEIEEVFNAYNEDPEIQKIK